VGVVIVKPWLMNVAGNIERRNPMTPTRVRFLVAIAGVTGLILGMAVSSVTDAQEPGRQQRRVIRPEKAPNTGLPFSPGILMGNTLYIAGHLGRDPVTSQLVPGGIEAETRQVLANIREVLGAAGMDFNDVVSVTAYITSFNDFEKFNAVYRQSFAKDPPARATVQVAALNAGAKIELQMIAARP
jgi:2-iminobutanoate/2-iminopropanoate deaminase